MQRVNVRYKLLVSYFNIFIISVIKITATILNFIIQGKEFRDSPLVIIMWQALSVTEFFSKTLINKSS